VARKKKAKAGTKTGGRRDPKKAGKVKKTGAARAARKAPRKAARRPASSRAKVKGARGGARTRKAPARSKSVATRKAPAAGEMFGEGNWQADEEYREGLQEFSETPDAEALAREAAEELDDDLVDTDDDDVTESTARPAEEEPEW
jgi:hypothetical protein